MHGYHRPVFVLGTHRNSKPRNAKTARSSVIVTMRVFSALSDTPIASASQRIRASARSPHAFPFAESGASTTMSSRYLA
jgi:hypothetical protein